MIVYMSNDTSHSVNGKSYRYSCLRKTKQYDPLYPYGSSESFYDSMSNQKIVRLYKNNLIDEYVITKNPRINRSQSIL